MLKREIILLLLFTIVIYLQIRAQENQLFNENKPLKITLKYNPSEIDKDRTQENMYHDAILNLESDNGAVTIFKVKLKPRGTYRLKSKNCYFPFCRYINT